MSGAPKKVALVGARGHVGKEVVRLIDQDPDFALTLATSRENAGKPVGEILGAGPDDLLFTESDPDAVADAGADAVLLGLPNGLAAPFVEAIERTAPETVIVDISADYRHVQGWIFGLVDLHADDIRGATRIANPGCYATAGILSLYPLRDVLDGTPSIFGLSGYSGAGTTPGPRNDPERLRDNVLPYGFAGHGHQAEISATIGRPVRFVPHVAAFFRGLITTVTAPLKPGVSVEGVKAAYARAYEGNPTVHLQDEPPEPRQAANTVNAIIGGVAIDPATHMLAVTCAHDNLLKGAASQALANARLGLKLD